MSNCCKENKDKCCGIGLHIIPAALGDDTGEFKPENGAYHNMLVKYEENGALYLYSNDGIYTKIGENVENNVPEDNNTLSFTMQYDAGTASNGFPGWSQLGITELITKTVQDSDVRKMAIGWDGSTEHPVTFLNDATGETITPQDLYALLLDGADVTLNHVPLGWMLSGEAFIVDPYCDGVHLAKYFTSDGTYSNTGFGGSASVDIYFPDVNNAIQTQLGFSISGYEDEGGMVFSIISVQGLYAA